MIVQIYSLTHRITSNGEGGELLDSVKPYPPYGPTGEDWTVIEEGYYYGGEDWTLRYFMEWVKAQMDFYCCSIEGRTEETDAAGDLIASCYRGLDAIEAIPNNPDDVR